MLSKELALGLVGVVACALGLLMVFRQGFAEGYVKRSPRGRLWVGLLGSEEKAVAAMRRVFGPITVVLGIGLLTLSFVGFGNLEDPAHEPAPGTTWQVVATQPGDTRIEAIKAIREVTRLGLQDAKDLFDAIPSVILSGVSSDGAEVAAQRLRAAGMTVEIVEE